MATVIQIKRSTGAGAPTTTNLAEAELAYSQDKSNDGANAILYIESVNNDDSPIIHKVGGKYYTDIVDSANSESVANTIVKRDAAGSFSANIITAENFVGNISVGQLSVARNITLAGDLEGAASFDGSQDITIFANVISDGVALGTDTSGDYVANLTGSSGITISNFSGETSTLDVALADTAVSPATYGGATAIPVFTVNQQGRLTFATNASISSSFTLEADTGTDTFNTGDTLRFVGVAPGISTAVTDNTVSITNTGVTEVTSAGHGIVASAATGNVQLTFTGVGSITGTTNEIEVDVSTGNVTIGLPNDIIIGNDLTVSGNLIVLGVATTLNTQSLVVDDPLVKFGNANPTSVLDVGFYGEYTSSGTKYAGLFADSSDSYTFKLFKDLTVDPTGNTVSIADYVQATLQADITAGNVSSLVNPITVSDGGTGRVTLTANAVLYGDGTNPVALASGTSGQVLQIASDGSVTFGGIDGGTY